MLTLSFILFCIWAAALTLAIWAVRIAQRFAVRMPRIAAEPVFLEGPVKDVGDGVFPRVAVVLPIKGVDDDTQLNIQALLNQDYPEYRLIFTVESDDDPVLSILEKMATEDSRIEVVVAGLASSRGQKIHNQLAAVERTTEQDEVIAFMDADAKPDPLWLQCLVAPLTRKEIGATTGYRYYVPVTAHTANKIVSVLNAQVAALLGPYRRTFAWGGSMAMRRRDFFGFGLHQMWQHALSDDYVLSYCVKNVAKSKLHFVPNCLVASEANFNWASLFEFAVRQYRITKVCAPWVWLTAIGGAVLYLTALTSTLANAIYHVIRPSPERPWEALIQFSMFATLYALTIVRGLLLVRGGQRLVNGGRRDEASTDIRREIGKTLVWATLGMPWCYVINLLALLGSAFGRNIVWRGIAYQMVSRTQTVVERLRATAAVSPQRVAEEAELQ